MKRILRYLSHTGKLFWFESQTTNHALVAYTPLAASKLLCGVLLLLPTTETYSKAIELTIGSAHFCPYICVDDSTKRHYGFMVELASTIGKLKGIEIHTRVEPFSRVARLSERGEIAGIFLLVSTYDRSPYIITDIQVNFHPCFFVHRGDSWEYNGLNSLKNKTIGLIQGYTYPDTILNHLAVNTSSPKPPAEYVASEKAQTQNIRKVVAGRIDALYGVRAVIDWAANKNRLNTYIREAGCPTEDVLEANLVISKAYPNAEAITKTLNEGFEEIKDTKIFEQLKRKYHIQ